MKKSNEILTDKQLKTMPLLLDAKTNTEGCKKARIAPKTFYKWLKDPVFKDELKRQRDGINEDALESLKGSMAGAVTALRNLLDTTNNDSLKRYVAKDIIDYVVKARELEDLDKRVGDLEETINNTECYSVVIGTPINLNRIINIKKTNTRLYYYFHVIGKSIL